MDLNVFLRNVFKAPKNQIKLNLNFIKSRFVLRQILRGFPSASRLENEDVERDRISEFSTPTSSSEFVAIVFAVWVARKMRFFSRLKPAQNVLWLFSNFKCFDGEFNRDSRFNDKSKHKMIRAICDFNPLLLSESSLYVEAFFAFNVFYRHWQWMKATSERSSECFFCYSNRKLNLFGRLIQARLLIVGGFVLKTVERCFGNFHLSLALKGQLNMMTIRWNFDLWWYNNSKVGVNNVQVTVNGIFELRVTCGSKWQQFSVRGGTRNNFVFNKNFFMFSLDLVACLCTSDSKSRSDFNRKVHMSFNFASSGVGTGFGLKVASSSPRWLLLFLLH